MLSLSFLAANSDIYQIKLQVTYHETLATRKTTEFRSSRHLIVKFKTLSNKCISIKETLNGSSTPARERGRGKEEKKIISYSPLNRRPVNPKEVLRVSEQKQTPE